MSKWDDTRKRVDNSVYRHVWNNVCCTVDDRVYSYVQCNMRDDVQLSIDNGIAFYVRENLYRTTWSSNE